MRTSETDPIKVGWLEGLSPGRVGLTIAPGKKYPSQEAAPWHRNLASDLDRLATEHGVGLLVCLLEDHELTSLGIPTLEPEAAARGIDFHRLPIVDGGIPRDDEAVDEAVDRIITAVSHGKSVVVHCAAGLGRSGTIGGCTLVRCGSSVDDALRALVAARGHRCPENEAQRQYIRRYAMRRLATYEDALEGIVALDVAAMAVSDSGRVSRQEVGRRLGDVEREVSASPSKCFEVDVDGMATLRAAGRVYQAGRFTTPSIGELRSRLAERGARGTLRFSALVGEDALTDIGTLQAAAEPGVLFQVASQFNCLEAPSARLVPIHRYVSDPTQGPRASVSAFPGTFLRHYWAPGSDGEVFVQSSAQQINLLADAFEDEAAAVRHGYLTPSTIGDAPALARLLEDTFERIRVGVHDDVEVVFGHNWGGPVSKTRRQRVAQVFTSTIALGGYGSDNGSSALATIRRQLLRAAYLGTLLAALDLGKHAVVLTLIGGGVFGNPHRDIADAIVWALGEADALAPRPLHVVLNARTLDRTLSRKELQAIVGSRGGVFAERARPSLRSSRDERHRDLA